MTCLPTQNNHLAYFRAYMEDTDSGGVVYHANYLKYTERARSDWMRTFGYDRKFIKENACIFVVHSLDIKFCTPAVLDDMLCVKSKVNYIAKTYIDLAQDIYRDDNTLIVKTNVRVALVCERTMKPTRIPQNLYNIITNMEKE